MIVLLDDSKTVQVAVELNLKKRGYTVISPHNMQFAYDYIVKNMDEITVVILDYEMPEMNGLEFAMKIREAGYEKHVIFFTSRQQESLNAACKEAQACWVEKQFDLARLAKVIDAKYMDICEDYCLGDCPHIS